MRNKFFLMSVMFIFFTGMFLVSDSHSMKMDYKIINIDKISRYSEDRVAFQHIEKKTVEHVYDEIDNSIACLLIIKDKKMYLFKDGYDRPFDIQTQKSLLERENKLIPDMWKNKVDDNPDYIMVTDRRVEIQKNETQDFVSKNYKDFYISIRDEFVKKHVAIFKALLINRKDSYLVVEKIPLPRGIYDDGPTKFAIKVSGKTIDEKLYFAEDGDGDGITETFCVQLADGFNWGYKSGPNLIFIHNCQYTDGNNNPKNQKIKELIGDLAQMAYYGTPEEEQIIKKTFPKSEKINDMIDQLYQIDADSKKLLRDNNIDLEKGSQTK